MNHENPTPPNPGDSQSIDALQEALGPDFEVKQKLGKGSMATVYLAKEKALGRFVAVKVLLPGRAKDETARKRFEREAKASASLVHPNVVQVFRMGRLRDETPYLVMRFVEETEVSEIAEAFGWSITTSRRRIQRARDVFLKKAMRDPLLASYQESLNRER